MDLSADGWAQEPESGPQYRKLYRMMFGHPFFRAFPSSLERRISRTEAARILGRRCLGLESENYIVCQAQAQRLKEEVATVLRGLD